jgi:hypothetical protein
MGPRGCVNEAIFVLDIRCMVSLRSVDQSLCVHVLRGVAKNFCLVHLIIESSNSEIAWVGPELHVMRESMETHLMSGVIPVRLVMVWMINEHSMRSLNLLTNSHSNHARFLVIMSVEFVIVCPTIRSHSRFRSIPVSLVLTCRWMI